MNYFKGTSEFADVVAKLAEKLELGKNCTVNDFELRVKKTRSEKTVSFRIVLSKKLKVKTSNKSPAKVTRQMKRRLQQEQKGHAQMFMPGLPSAPPSAPSSHQEIRPPALRSENYGSQKPNILPKQQSNAPTTSSAVTNLSFAHEDHEKIDSLSEEQKLGTVPTTASAELKISDKNDSLISNKRHKRKPLTSPDKPQRVTAVLTSPALAGAKPESFRPAQGQIFGPIQLAPCSFRFIRRHAVHREDNDCTRKCCLA